MVMFNNLHTEAGLRSLEEYLSAKTYISGDQLGMDDIKVYEAISEKPDAAIFANCSRWYHTVSSAISNSSFPGNAVGVRTHAVPGNIASAPGSLKTKENYNDDCKMCEHPSLDDIGELEICNSSSKLENLSQYHGRSLPSRIENENPLRRMRVRMLPRPVGAPLNPPIPVFANRPSMLPINQQDYISALNKRGLPHTLQPVVTSSRRKARV